VIPAKNRDRKCSTCRHYQPSPLWRKGWCRNPLLYDRNTNHLVEADSLACNRTFIDYWEPMTGPAREVAPQARSSKPRIAPSIPMSTTDSKGNKDIVTGNTPAAGMAAAAAAQAYTPNSREVPKLSIVTPDYEPDAEHNGNGSAAKATKQIPLVPAPPAEAGTAVEAPVPNAAQRIRDARKLRRSQFLSSTTGRLIIIAGVLLLLLALGGGMYLYAKQPPKQPSVPVLAIAPTTTKPAPTPTGLGDATATPAPTPTTAAPPPGVIGLNGWVMTAAGGGLTVRDAPAKKGARITVLRDGTIGHVVDGPKDADGYTWWKLDRFDPAKPDVSGWVAGQFLKATEAPKP
jgi:hypothetical protein